MTTLTLAAETPLVLNREGHLPHDIRPHLTVVSPQGDTMDFANVQFLPTGEKPPRSIYGPAELWLNLDLINQESQPITVVLANWMMIPFSTYLVKHLDEAMISYQGYADKNVLRDELSFFTHQIIEAKPGLTRVFWRIKSPWLPIPLEISLNSEQAFNKSLEIRTGYLNIYIGSILTFIIICLLSYLLDGERIMVIYCFVATAYVTIQLCLTGIHVIRFDFLPFIGQYVWPLFIVFTLIASVGLIMEFLDKRKIHDKKTRAKFFSIIVLPIVLIPLAYFDAVAFTLALMGILVPNFS